MTINDNPLKFNQHEKVICNACPCRGHHGCLCQTETDSTAVVNKGITPVKEVYPQKEEDGDLYHGLTRKLDVYKRQALASANMSNYIRYLFKTVRKFFGEAVVVTQEVEDRCV